ncbi:MAG: hypothetical protein RSF81_04055, partial [Oscillospiraceae bacterium]
IVTLIDGSIVSDVPNVSKIDRAKAMEKKLEAYDDDEKLQSGIIITHEDFNHDVDNDDDLKVDDNSDKIILDENKQPNENEQPLKNENVENSDKNIIVENKEIKPNEEIK